MELRAKIIDITKDTPSKDDALVVDTNVLFWWFFPDNLTENYDVRRKGDYDTYLEKLSEVGAQLFYCQASLIELAHVVEKNKRNIFNQANTKTLNEKMYRHDYPQERENVLEAIHICCDSVMQVASPIDMQYDTHSIQQTLTDMSSYQVDAYDMMQINAMKEHGILNILTDDVDYATVSGISVFTSSYRSLNLASTAGRSTMRP